MLGALGHDGVDVGGMSETDLVPCGALPPDMDLVLLLVLMRDPGRRAGA